MQKGLEQFFQDADKGKEKFEELRKLSNETTFGVDELANSFTQLANVGVNVDTINDKLVMLGNIAGGSKEKFADLVSIYSKIQSTGKVTGMQLQQIASRGIPIYDTLKKIGVTGSASAKDVTKAFEKLTTEFDETTGKAGQFYNAMNNINDTIEGKEGFIADYFKEMTVNFAEASGIADAYKGALDTIRNAIGWISDALLKINENPVMKAIFQGLFVGALGALVAVIVTALIPALVSVIAKLSIIATLKAMINPAMLAIGAGIGVVVGALSFLNSETEKNDKSSKKYVESLKSETEEINNQIDALKEQLELKNQVAGVPNSYTEEETEEIEKQVELLKEKARLEEANNTDQVLATNIKLYKKEHELAQREVARIKNMIAQAEAEFGPITDDQMSKVGLFEDLEYAESEVKRLADQIEKAEKYAINLKKAMDNKTALQEQVDILNGQYKNAIDDIAQRWSKTSEGQLEDLEAQLDMYKNIQKMQQQGRSGAKLVKSGSGADVIQYENNWTNAEIEKTNKLLSNIEKEVFDIRAKTMEEQLTGEMTDYQAWILSQMGVSLKEEMAKVLSKKDSDYIVKDGSKYKLNVGTANYLGAYSKANNWEKYESIEKQVKGIAKDLGVSESSELQKEVDALKESITKLAEYAQVAKADGTGSNKGLFYAGQWAVNNKELVKALEAYQKKLKEVEVAKMNELVKENEATMKFLNNEKYNVYSLQEKIKYRYQLEKGFTEEEIKQLKEAEKQAKKLSIITNPENYKDINGFANVLKADNKQIAGGMLAGASGILNGTDYGIITDGIVGIVNEEKNFKDVIGDLVEHGFGKLLASINNIDIVLNPIADALVKLAPLVKTILIGLIPIVEAIGWLFDGIMKILNWLTGGFFDEMNDLWDEYAQSAENAKKSTEELAKEQESLLQAMKKQEEYYLSMKKQINSDSYRDSVYSVNDMILTPNGRFSTSPEDTIIAMKKPEELMNNNNVISVKIINNANVDVSARQNGNDEMLITISQKVANDYAYGLNGWDSAIEQQKLVQNGRSR